MCECLTLDSIVNWEPQQEAIKRIPSDLKHTSFFSAFDLYTYKAITDDRTCKTCMIYDNMILSGDLIRAYYPYLEIIGQDQILPKVHPNCRCTILRVTDLSDYIDYTEPIPDFPSVKNTEPTILPRYTPDYIKDTVRTTTLDDLGIELSEKKQDAKKKPT
jgi:hypothetical protein